MTTGLCQSISSSLTRKRQPISEIRKKRNHLLMSSWFSSGKQARKASYFTLNTGEERCVWMDFINDGDRQGFRDSMSLTAHLSSLPQHNLGQNIKREIITVNTKYIKFLMISVNEWQTAGSCEIAIHRFEVNLMLASCKLLVITTGEVKCFLEPPYEIVTKLLIPGFCLSCVFPTFWFS